MIRAEGSLGSASSAEADGPTRPTHPIEHVRTLALDIGPRAPGSAGDERAAEHVRRTLSRSGWSPQTDTFRAPATRTMPDTVPLAVGIIAAGVTPFRPVAGAILGLAALVLYTLEALGIGFLGKLVAWRRTRNVWATQRATGPAFLTVVLVAHLDAGADPGSLGRVIRRIAGPDAHVMRVANGFVLVALFLSALFAVETEPALAMAAPFLAIPLAAALAGTVALARKGRRSEGAESNASGVGAVLAVASAVANRPLEHTTLEVLFTGAATSGHHGMHRFLDAHGRHYARARTLFINVDRVGCGTLAAPRMEGGLVPLPGDLEIASALAVGSDFARARLATPRFSRAGSDASAALMRRRRAATLTTLEPSVGPDTFANVRGSVVSDAAGVLLGAILAIDSGAARAHLRASTQQKPKREWKAKGRNGSR